MQPQITVFWSWIQQILFNVIITMQMSLELLDHASMVGEAYQNPGIS